MYAKWCITRRYKILYPEQFKKMIMKANKQQTAMQCLRSDLQESIIRVKKALDKIDNIETRETCKDVVQLALNAVIKRIDYELLEMEKQQIIEAFWNGDNTDCLSEQNAKEFAEIYYNETFNK